MKRFHIPLLMLACAAFSVLYLDVSTLLPQSQVSFHARLMVDSPFVYRILIPYTLGQVLPPGWLDTDALKYLFAGGATLVSLLLMPAFAERLTGSRPAGWRLWVLWGLCLAMLLAHYCAPRPYMYYYIYDLPAIALYMLCFLALSSSGEAISWRTLALVLVASLNRETVVVALCHALGFHLASQAGALGQRVRAIKGFVLGAAWALGLIVLARVGLNLWIQPQGEGNVAYMESDHIRVVAGLYWLTHDVSHMRAAFLFGCGALLWLPMAYRDLPPRLKGMVMASLPPLLMLLVAGNITELRIYGEFIPMLSVALLVFAGPLMGERA